MQRSQSTNEAVAGDTSGLGSRVLSSMGTLSALCDDIEARHKALDEKEARWKKQEEVLAANAAKINNKVHLNIGGKRFTTTKATLLSKSSYFEAMLKSNHNQQDEAGEFFIDRNSKLFSFVLDYLRTGTLPTGDLTKQQFENLQEDFKFYQLPFPRVVPEPTLLSIEHSALIRQWLPGASLRLLYRATKDGFEGWKFHKFSDNKGATLVVIKSHPGLIFGGYNPTSWTSSNQYISDCRAFLFTLTNQPSKFSTKSFRASHIYDAENTHACFGNDLVLSVNPQTVNCTSSFPSAYHDDSSSSSTSSFAVLRNPFPVNFHAAEIEVYTA